MICLLYIDCIASNCRFQFLDYSPLVFEKSWMHISLHPALEWTPPYRLGIFWLQDHTVSLRSFSVFLEHKLILLYVVGVHSMYCVTLNISFSVFGCSDFSLHMHRVETLSLFLSSLRGFLIHHQISLFWSEYNSQTSILFTCTFCILKNWMICRFKDLFIHAVITKFSIIERNSEQIHTFDGGLSILSLNCFKSAVKRTWKQEHCYLRLNCACVFVSIKSMQRQMWF